MSTKLAGVIGYPVAHSLSPRLHGFWLREHGIDGAFVPLPAKREDFAQIVNSLRKLGFTGLSVTVPHKESAFAIAHDLDEAAQIAGAVNLLVFEGARIEGRNTDAPGLAASLVEQLGKDALKGKDAVLLGAGGAARACVLALANLGAKKISILNRNVARAETLARSLEGKISAQLAPAMLSDWGKAAGTATLAINATSAGMSGAPALEISLDALPKTAAVCDIVYNPLETPLLKQARAKGLKTIDGLGMLMHQAVPAFEAFYGVKPKVTPALRAELEKALK
jgi:shikimate dehydrogenase